MSTPKKEDATYELIVNTAKRLFFKEGKFHATTQEIADAAGVNRTLINYYFRSRDTLFELVLQKAIEEEEKRREMIVFSDLPVREKLEQFIDYHFEQAKEYPYREVYMITQMNNEGFCVTNDKKHIKRLTEKFYIELENEMKDFVVGEVRSSLGKMDIKTLDITQGEGKKVIQDIIDLTYSTLEK